MHACTPACILLAGNAHVPLTLPRAHAVHRRAVRRSCRCATARSCPSASSWPQAWLTSLARWDCLPMLVMLVQRWPMCTSTHPVCSLIHPCIAYGAHGPCCSQRTGGRGQQHQGTLMQCTTAVAGDSMGIEGPFASCCQQVLCRWPTLALHDATSKAKTTCTSERPCVWRSSGSASRAWTRSSSPRSRMSGRSPRLAPL